MKKPTLRACVIQAVTDASDPLSAAEVEQTTGCTTSYVKILLKELIVAGKLQRRERVTEYHVYEYWPADKEWPDTIDLNDEVDDETWWAEQAKLGFKQPGRSTYKVQTYPRAV